MKLQTSTRLAVYAVLELAAAPEDFLPSPEIADRYGVSLNHLSKVMRTLGRAGVVEASRGVGGGYRFRGNAKRLTLLDVMELFEDPTGNDHPPAHSAAPDQPVNREVQALERVLQEVDDVARLTLDSITIATMLKLAAGRR